MFVHEKGDHYLRLLQVEPTLPEMLPLLHGIKMPSSDLISACTIQSQPNKPSITGAFICHRPCTFPLTLAPLSSKKAQTTLLSLSKRQFLHPMTTSSLIAPFHTHLHHSSSMHLSGPNAICSSHLSIFFFPFPISHLPLSHLFLY